MAFGFVTSFLLAFMFNASEASAFQCVDFSTFPATSILPSPVVAPPGESLPSDIQFDYIEDYIPSDDEYFFGRFNTEDGEITFLTAQYAGFLRITFDTPRTVGSLIFKTMHFNQPELEYRTYSSTSPSSEITPGWIATNDYPNFDQNDPPHLKNPRENKEYTMSLSGQYFTASPIQVVEVRNLSRKNYFSSVCVL